jgi:FkbM family methyltransferase
MSFHAEDQIDRVVREAFFPDYGYKGVLVEVGAAGPEYLSISRHFRDHGWRVVAIEPNPTFCEMHRQAGFEVLQYACGDRDEDDVDFQLVYYVNPYQGGHVTYEAFSALRVLDSYRTLKPDLTIQTIKVNLRRLDTILAEHASDLDKIDILAIDVEGWEIVVLKGFSLERYAPNVIVVENLFNDDKYHAYINERGYRLHLQMKPNEIYVRQGA